MTIDLEPCPFCGSGAVFARDNDEDGAFVAVQCTGCGCGSGKHYPIMDSADANAANEWNARVPSAAARERDGLRERVSDLLKVIDMVDADYVGEGVHSGLRKGTDTDDSHKLWSTIADSTTTAWRDACDYFVWGFKHHADAAVKAARQALQAGEKG